MHALSLNPFRRSIILDRAGGGRTGIWIKATVSFSPTNRLPHDPQLPVSFCIISASAISYNLVALQIACI